MYLLLIAGITSILLGAVLLAVGIRQGMRRVVHEGEFLPAEAQVTELERRMRILTVHHIIPVGFVFEYSVHVTYHTPQGDEIAAALPFVLGASREVRAARRSLRHREPMEILYDPGAPAQCHCGSKTFFHIREVLYKFVVSGILIAIGAWLIWWQGHI